MDKPPKVSVILPFFNAEQTLGNAIQSIINQSFTNWELILIDNNSSDRSSQIARSFCEKDTRIKCVHEPRQGVVFAANKGGENAQGTYLARMDADDISYPNRLRSQVAFLDEKEEIGLVSGQVAYVGNTDNGGFIRYVDWLNTVKSSEQIRLNQFAEYPLANPSVMFRSELLKTYGVFKEGKFPEDYEFFLRMQSGGVRMEKIHQTIIAWHDSSTRLTRTDPRYSQEAFFKLKAKYLGMWLQRNNKTHPKVYIWGAGRLAKKRSSYLIEQGIDISGYIDIVRKGKDVIYYKDLDAFSSGFILSYVTSWDARLQVREYLDMKGFQEGINYLICG